MLDVLITVDTEFWPSQPRPGGNDFSDDVRRDIAGRTPAGDFGLPFQLKLLREHNLSAIYLVESLCALAAGDEVLNDIVGQIRAAGQEVQLHLHPEWLDWIPNAPLVGAGRQHMHQFALDEQATLVELGASLLQRCGVTVSAFRAGNYGADLNTLLALAKNKLIYDTSYNAAYLDKTCRMDTESLLVQPAFINGVWEYPITYFGDMLGKRRHLQIVACSKDELQHALWQAIERQWTSVVIVLHSFELIDRMRRRADRMVIDRFEWLCRFLADHRDHFQTTTFAALGSTPQGVGQETVDGTPLKGKMLPTSRRLVEQLIRRIPRLS